MKRSRRRAAPRRNKTTFRAREILTREDLHRIDLALREDLGQPLRDLTTRTLFKGRAQRDTMARIISKSTEEIVVCGLPVLRAIFARLAKSCRVVTSFQDGERLRHGETLCTIHGPAQAILAGERTALNFLQHLCAIATLTSHFVRETKGTPLKILDTRKTTPCLRHLEKYAVFCGGGLNHRMGLYDAILIKNNHIDELGGMRKTLDKLPKTLAKAKAEGPQVVVEVRSVAELQDVLEVGEGRVHRALLDNMTTEELRACVRLAHGRLETEASGGIHLGNISEIAATGVDYASVGQLTHSAGSVDLALRMGKR